MHNHTGLKVQQCPSDEVFKCDNGDEICGILVCNAVPDCDDGTDEEACGKFESSLQT